MDTGYTTHVVAPRSQDMVGEYIDGYYLIDFVGEGGMGAVYRAVSPETGDHVALKIVKSSVSSDEVALRRFEREINVASQLEHPHILPILSISISKPHLYMVMPFVNNGSLDGFLRYGALPTPRQAQLVVEQIGSALHFAHDQGIIHRDVKPDNILLCGHHEVALTDFGLAKFADNAATRLTVTGTVVGTPGYMSPEQALGYPMDLRTDIYSLALVFYRMLLGRLPFSAESPIAMVNQQINSLPIRPSQINPSFPEALEQVLFTALAKDRDDRFASMAAFVNAIQHGMETVDNETYSRGHLVTEEQIETSREIVPEVALTRVLLVPGSINLDSEPPPATLNLPVYEETRGGRISLLALALILLVVCLGAVVSWQRIVKPLEQRAVSAELTAQATAEQTPIIITQVVTNSAGEIVIIEATRLVTASAEEAVTDVTEEAPDEPVFQSSVATPTLSATSTPTPTLSPITHTPQPAAPGGGSDGGQSSSNSNNPDSSSSSPDPTQPPASTPTSEPGNTDPAPAAPGNSGDAPGQANDGANDPGNSGNPPDQSDNSEGKPDKP